MIASCNRQSEQPLMPCDGSLNDMMVVEFETGLATSESEDNAENIR